MADEPPTAAREGGHHLVDVLGFREQQHGGGLDGNLPADLVDEGVVEMGGVLGVAEAARGAAGHQPDGDPRGSEEDAGGGAGHRPLRGAPADDVTALVQVDVATGERAAHHDPVVPVGLYERHLPDPGRAARCAEDIRIRVLRAFDVIEDDEREIEAHARDATSTGTALASSRPGDVAPCSECAWCMARRDWDMLWSDG